MTFATSEVIELRKLFALAELTQLRGDGEVEVRWVSIPDTFKTPGNSSKIFDKDTMRALSDEGKRLGSDTGTWNTTPP